MERAWFLASRWLAAPPRAAPGCREALARGVAYSVVYGAEVPRDPLALEAIRNCVDLGEHARVFPNVALNLLICDDRFAVVHAPPREHHPRHHIAVQRSALLDGLIGVFESYWQMAVPLPTSDEAMDDVGAALTDDVRQLLTSSWRSPTTAPAAEMINCGHPPPLLVHDQRVTVLHARQPLPPLGVCERPIEDDGIDPFTFEGGDMLVLYTDGVIEARSPSRAFYPLAERVASFPATNPDALLHHIHRDLLAHAGGHLADDAALLVIERAPSHRPHLTPHPIGHHGLGGSPPPPGRDTV
ncbi:PP2C family protein-serine/threonine phosphatase [Streptomyces sp. NPDC057543]|uniref:PP2C family protein-serine/threonine phosphatase n=1 Tax=Streptomyces sp. NPDC057543 TaxID=3346163 RepID=UPI003695BA9A